MKNHIFLFFFLTLFYSASTQTLSAVADKQKILIGEPLQLQLQARFPKGQPTAWFQIDSILHFETLKRSGIDTLDSGREVSYSETLLLTSWDSGQWQIPSFRLGGAHTTPLKIDVAFSPHPFDPNQPYHEMKDIIEVKPPAESKWYWYLILVIVLLALFILFFPREKKKESPAFVADEGAYRTALKKLEKLKPEDADSKGLYTELVHIFREYLKKRKNIHSFSQTTDDLAIQMDRLELPREQYHRLVQTLRLSDLVKFARFQPRPEENREAIEKIRESIENIENLPHAV